jgi:hypothetical protein
MAQIIGALAQSSFGNWVKTALATTMKPQESGNYALSVPHRNDEALDKTVHDLLTEINQESEMRYCL